MPEPMWQAIGKAYDLVAHGSADQIEGQSVGHTWKVTRENGHVNIRIEKTR